MYVGLCDKTISRADFFFPVFYLQLFAELHGLPPKLAFYAVSPLASLGLFRTSDHIQIPIMNAASLFGRTVPNFLGDAFGPFNGAFIRSRSTE